MVLKDSFDASSLGVEIAGFEKYSFIIALSVVGIAGWRIYSYFANYIDVPAVGIPPGIFGSWKASIYFFTNSARFIREGYAKYAPKGGMFKIVSIPRWYVFVTNPKHIQQMKNAPDDVLSFSLAARKMLAMDYTTTAHVEEDLFLIPIIRQNLTQRLAAILSDVNEEATLAFEDNIRVGNGWTKVKVWDSMLQVIARTTNRMFVGVPLSRNKEYLETCINYGANATATGAILNVTPAIFRPLLSWYLLNKPKRLREIRRFIDPIFEERNKKLQTLGDKWTDRPNDAIQWVLEAARGTWMDTMERMTMSILVLNLAAIHTTSLSITQALFDLAANPQFIPPIRDEIETVLAKDGGWTKQNITKMKKLDSALKESQRMNGVTTITMTREAQKPFKFSGTDITFPVGTFLCAPSNAIHFDSTVYENPFEYDAFRFSKMREQEGQEAKHQMVSTTDEYLAFGHGKHACPGRFFATNELKLLLAYIIRNYDFKLEDTYDKRPDNKYIDTGCVPDTKVELMFKRFTPAEQRTEE